MSDDVQSSSQNPIEDTNPRVRARNKRQARLLKHSISTQSAPTVDILRVADTPHNRRAKNIAQISTRKTARKQRNLSSHPLREMLERDGLNREPAHGEDSSLWA